MKYDEPRLVWTSLSIRKPRPRTLRPPRREGNTVTSRAMTRTIATVSRTASRLSPALSSHLSSHLLRPGAPVFAPRQRCVCLLLQYLLQSCSRGGRGIVEDMCYERRRAEACVVGPVRNPVL